MTRLTKETALREISTHAIIPIMSIMINITVPVTIKADIMLKPINRNDITKTPAGWQRHQKLILIMIVSDKPNETQRLMTTSSLMVKYCS